MASRSRCIVMDVLTKGNVARVVLPVNKLGTRGFRYALLIELHW